MNTQATLKIISLSMGDNRQLPPHVFDSLVKAVEHVSANTLSRNCDNITQLLNRAPLLGFSILLSHIDSNFPGLSFYYVMEAKQSKSIEGLYFIKRLQLLQRNGLLHEIFASMRCRLIEGLLEDSLHVENTLDDIRANFDLPEPSIDQIRLILQSKPIDLPFLDEKELMLLLNFA